MSVKVVTKDAILMSHINANSRVVTVCPSLHAHSPTFESRANNAIGILGVRYV